MGKRKADLSEDQYEFVRQSNNDRKRRQRQAMNNEQKDLQRQRNREAKRLSRQRLREATGQGTQPGPSSDCTRAAVEAAMQRIFDAQPLPDLRHQATSAPSDSPAPREPSPPPRDPSPPPREPSFPLPRGPSPPPPRDPSLRDSSPLTSSSVDDVHAPRDPPKDPLDLVTGVHGVQVSSNALTVTWTSGQRTVLPYLEGRDKRRKRINLLQPEAEYVKDMTALPECRVSSDFVQFLDGNLPKSALLKAAREALSLNKAVVIRGFLDVTGFELSMDGLMDEFNTLPTRPVGIHDMRERSKKFSNPHVDTTVESLIKDINNPKVMRVALDFPLPQLSAPNPLEKLDDGLCLGWAQTQNIFSVDDQLLTGDVWTVRSWGLVHHAGILTYEHHDAEGALTWAANMAGEKDWMLVSFKESPTREEMAERVKQLTNPSNRLHEFTNRVEALMLHLRPSDAVIMPPGQIHGVFTPVASVCRGGHFFNLDAMHLTELSRFVDASSAKYVTNQAHRGTLDTLCRIVLILPFLPRTRSRRSLICLCGMVCYHGKYTAQGEEEQQSPCLVLAKQIAMGTLDHFGLYTLEDYDNFFSDPSQYLFDRGEELDDTIYSFLAGFRVLCKKV
ncbi:hypothetical protein JVT61DRAFT_15614 [Boletus reticuloceps]|uniref:JmjC domain-containing protein n=1 Tax=Boletus reticuloceps TaxID=495285 RepID=A0A8I2YBV6_9AGAM|nr:hypothetical protein JVT61DRAFT_1963 [Boletus reticuloceps]KAG6369215.1 hypothetical protein JVT61DRAFT_15614 [Boletus reticuloceps]